MSRSLVFNEPNYFNKLSEKNTCTHTQNKQTSKQVNNNNNTLNDLLFLQERKKNWLIVRNTFTMYTHSDITYYTVCTKGHYFFVVQYKRDMFLPNLYTHPVFLSVLENTVFVYYVCMACYGISVLFFSLFCCFLLSCVIEFFFLSTCCWDGIYVRLCCDNVFFHNYTITTTTLLFISNGFCFFGTGYKQKGIKKVVIITEQKSCLPFWEMFF